MATLNATGYVRARIEDKLGVTCRVTVPSPRPSKLVVVTQEGGRRLDQLRDQPGIGVYCYAPTEADAERLASSVSDLMLALPFGDGVLSVSEETRRSSRDPDEPGQPLWYASYTLQTYRYQEV